MLIPSRRHSFSTPRSWPLLVSYGFLRFPESMAGRQHWSRWPTPHCWCGCSRCILVYDYYSYYAEKVFWVNAATKGGPKWLKAASSWWASAILASGQASYDSRFSGPASLGPGPYVPAIWMTAGGVGYKSLPEYEQDDLIPPHPYLWSLCGRRVGRRYIVLWPWSMHSFAHEKPRSSSQCLFVLDLGFALVWVSCFHPISP